MVHNNKVLTVSYGTFSCTLEGFEDSFGTMQAIAEYFRDLAADDRYFGAEPPQPDAQMLAQIAQREVTRQVEARTSSEGIHLRAASPALVPDATATDAPAPQAPPAQPPVETAPAAEQPAPRSVEQDIPAEEDAIDLSSVDLFEDNAPEVPAAATAADDIEVEDESSAQTNTDQASAAEEDAAPVAGAASVDMKTIAAISAAVADKQAADDSLEEVAPGAAEFFAEAEETEPEAKPDTKDASAKSASADPAPSADSIAAKLQRIRAVVAQTPEEEFSEDEHAESFVESARAELTQSDAEGEAEVEATAEAAADDGDDEISRVLDRLDLSGHLAAPAQDDAETETSLFDDSAAEEDEEPDLDQVSLLAQESQDEASEQAQEDAAPARPRRSIRMSARQPGTEENAPAASEALPEPQPAQSQSEQSTGSPAEPAESDAAATSPQLRARIVKMKRSELEKIIASGNLEEVEDEGESSSASAPSSLDADEEADLLRELAAVEADLLASSAQEPQSQSDSTAPDTEVDSPEVGETEIADSGTASDEGTGPVAQPNAPRNAASSPDSDVSRLMAAAESKLEDPDNAKSRETYSHLRAAVAAAAADPAAKGSGATDAEPYREALASVVRPRRPEAGATAKAPRPSASGSRPAPLKLVAEQRIDPNPNVPVKPVRPRRIAALDDGPAPAKTEISGTFEDYAQERGAAELHELLEAAASYLSFVEGRDHFSRPQLMNKVRGLGLADFNREDGLRSFGQLLRDGKIEKAENGRFAATDDIGFRPSTRAAG